eukprot:SAG22_NODE_2178_length_2881_cov_37.496046_2_plen_69_part_00
MKCYNFTSYIDDIHGLCGNDLNNVINECDSPCLLSIVDILNSCLEDLTKMRFDVLLENVIEFCYLKNT